MSERATCAKCEREFLVTPHDDIYTTPLFDDGPVCTDCLLSLSHLSKMEYVEVEDDGRHTFRIAYNVRGSGADDFWGEELSIEVKAFNLRDALLQAADLPFPVLMGEEQQ